MPDWHESMQQTFEYYVVDPGTWRDTKRLDTVKSCSITRDLDTETLGSATLDVTDFLGECYIRVYLITIQNGVKERHPLGTFLVQTPSSSFDGKIRAVSMDAYTPLIELKENPPPLGYSLLKDDNVMDAAYRVIREHCRTPVVPTSCDITLYSDFVANTNDTWMSFASDLAANARYNIGLDELGRIIFLPKQDLASLQPIWTYTDDDKSILYQDITVDHDLFGVPNIVEVTYSKDGEFFYAKVVNDDPNSPVSTVNRGREILHRITNPNLGNPTQYQIDEYAKQALKELSSVEYTVSFSHGYCPVRLGDCVRHDYKRAGLNNVKAKVISQTIKCEPGCPVTEKAVFNAKLWR